MTVAATGASTARAQTVAPGLRRFPFPFRTDTYRFPLRLGLSGLAKRDAGLFLLCWLGRLCWRWLDRCRRRCFRSFL